MFNQFLSFCFQVAAHSAESKISNNVLGTSDSSNDITETPLLPPQQVIIKEEIDDSLQDEDDDSMSYDHACSQCSRTFKTEEILNCHVKESHSMGFCCIICNDSFLTTKEVNEHSKTVHNFTICEYCLGQLGRYSCSFKGNICNHEYKMTETTDSQGLAQFHAPLSRFSTSFIKQCSKRD